VICIAIDDPYDLGEEFFRWEFATAVAGSILGINPFDQPDVEASKIATRKLTDEYESSGVLPQETPVFSENGIELFTDEKNASALSKAMNGTPTLAGYLKAHLNRLKKDDYFALLAYLEMSETHERVLQEMRQSVRNFRRVATCLEFGPRFLHSTGQAYKGGPNTGVFLQITCDDAVDLQIAGALDVCVQLAVAAPGHEGADADAGSACAGLQQPALVQGE
jgi:transaldolase/glucose-6-phosphate isomerase